MKGPSERLKYDMRRIWECPICRHREGTGGHVTSRLCNCQAQVPAVARQFMRLVQDGAKRVIAPRAPAVSEQVTPAAAAIEILVATTATNIEASVETTLVVDQTSETPVELAHDPNASQTRPSDPSNSSDPSESSH